MTNPKTVSWIAVAVAALLGQMFSQGVPAQPATPTLEIKGNHMGETIEEFMTAEGKPERLRECSELLLHPKKRSKEQVAECAQLGDGLAGRTVVLEPDLPDHTLAEMTFAENKLVRICLSFYETHGAIAFWQGCQERAPHLTKPIGAVGPLLSFGQVLHDLTTKFGPPDTMAERRMQNVFGAIFTFPVATWTSRPDVTIYATQDRAFDTDDLVTSCHILQRAYADRIYQSQPERPNALQ